MANKEFKTFLQQKEILESRNLIFSYPKKNLKTLSSINYYILTGYKTLLLDSDNSEKYKNGATFDDLYSLYLFDRKLRILFLDTILEIEQEIKTQIAYNFSSRNSKPDAYLIINSYDVQNIRTESVIKSIKKDITYYKKKSIALEHYYTKHKKLPLWVAVKVLTFGKIISMYDILKSNDKDNIAQTLFKIKIHKNRSKTLMLYMRLLKNIRNICAHDEMLFNFNHNGIKIPITDYHNGFNLMKNNQGEAIKGRGDLFAVLIALKHLMTRTRYREFIMKLNNTINKQCKNTTIYSKSDLLKMMNLPEGFENITKL